MTSSLPMEDGRRLEYFDNGIEANRAIVFHHGTPSDGTLWAGWLEQCAARGLRAIAYSRAGYGQSSPHRGRRVVSVNRDISQLLDRLSIRRIASIGWSGGGPHALANGLLGQSQGVILLASVGPYGVADLDFLDGMGPENHAEFGAAVNGETALSEWMAANAAGLALVRGSELREAFGGLVGPADRAVLEGQFAEDLAAVMRSALAESFKGWIDDDLAFVAPWGFDANAVKVPVKVWQGGEDLMVPRQHGQWLKRHLPHADLALIEGHGHISLTTAYRDAILEAAEELLG